MWFFGSLVLITAVLTALGKVESGGFVTIATTCAGAFGIANGLEHLGKGIGQKPTILRPQK